MPLFHRPFRGICCPRTAPRLTRAQTSPHGSVRSAALCSWGCAGDGDGARLAPCSPQHPLPTALLQILLWGQARAAGAAQCPGEPRWPLGPSPRSMKILFCAAASPPAPACKQGPQDRAGCSLWATPGSAGAGLAQPDGAPALHVPRQGRWASLPAVTASPGSCPRTALQLVAFSLLPPSALDSLIPKGLRDKQHAVLRPGGSRRAGLLPGPSCEGLAKPLQGPSAAASPASCLAPSSPHTLIITFGTWFWNSGQATRSLPAAPSWAFAGLGGAAPAPSAPSAPRAPSWAQGNQLWVSAACLGADDN